MLALFFIIALLIIVLAAGYTRGWTLKGGKGGQTGLLESSVRPKRQQQKKRVIGLFAGKERITNDDVQTLLGVSDATATRILDDMEHEGLITASGRGRGVHYVQN